MPAPSTNADEPIKPKFSLGRRFYSVVALNLCLREAYKVKLRLEPSAEWYPHAPSPSPSNPEPVTVGSRDRQTLKSFIDRLARICDKRRNAGGHTVTAIAILKAPDHVIYIVGSNQRTTAEVEENKSFLGHVLTIARGEGASHVGLEKDRRKPLFRNLLNKILSYNQERVHWYVYQMRKHLTKCIGECEQEHTALFASAKARLTTLVPLIQAYTSDRGVDTESYNSLPLDHSGQSDFVLDLEKAKLLIHHIHGFRHEDGDSLLTECAQKYPGMKESERWTELRHFMSRLDSYHRAAEAIVGARVHWPDLFETFEIETVPSAGSEKFVPRDATVARDVIHRMLPSDSDDSPYYGMVEALERGIDLSKNMQAKLKRHAAIVHAELLVYNHIAPFTQSTSQRRQVTPYFHDFSYIGSSKPTCFLCAQFFRLPNVDCEVRESHNNLYLNWRLPDVFSEDAARERDRILNAIFPFLKEKTFQAMSEKTAHQKPHDSEYMSTLPSAVRALQLTMASTRSTVSGTSLSSRTSATIVGSRVKRIRLIDPEGNEMDFQVPKGWKADIEREEDENLDGNVDGQSMVGAISDVGDHLGSDEETSS